MSAIKDHLIELVESVMVARGIPVSDGEAFDTIQSEIMSATYTLDAITPDGRYAEDHGLTLAQVNAAKANAPRLGITILAITEETPVNPSMLRAFAYTGFECGAL